MNSNTGNYIMPINEELINEAKNILREKIPLNSDDKYEMYKKLDGMFYKILEYRNQYIDSVIKDTLMTKSYLQPSVTITLCPEIEEVVLSILNRQQEIYKINK